jgi:hypothetical protein
VTDDDIMPNNFNEKKQIYLKVSNALRDIQEEMPIDLIVFTKPMYERFVELKSMFSRKILNNGIILI